VNENDHDGPDDGDALYAVAGALPDPHAAPLEGRWWVETDPAKMHTILRRPVTRTYAR
jgi:hypothetical protein